MSESTLGYSEYVGGFKFYASPHFELALKYFEEGRSLVDRDPVHACGKLYKSVEEAVKGLVIHFNLRDIVESAERAGEWSEREILRAVERLSRVLGEWVVSSWDSAWTLRTLCFQEARFSPEDVRARLPSIEALITVAQNISRVVPVSFMIEYVDRVFSRLPEKLRPAIKEEVEKSMSEISSKVDKLGESVNKTIEELAGRISSITGEIEKLRSTVEQIESRASRDVEELSRDVKSIKKSLKSRSNFILWLIGLKKRLFREESE
jgi:prefoldin subunit 5